MFRFGRLLDFPLFQRMPFYAVARGRVPGIYKTWDECKVQIEKFPGAAFKKFNTEVECKDFIADKSGGSKSQGPSKPITSSNSVARKALLTNPLEKKIGTEKQRTTKFTVPKEGPSKLAPSTDTGRPLKRSSTAQNDTEKKKFGRYEFETDDLGYVHVYTDGSCINNGNKDARAGLGVYWGEDHALNMSEPVRGKPTNNSGEIQAAIEAIKTAKEQGVKRLCINTDSQFVVKSITMWVPGWKRKGWKLADGGIVKNETDFKELDRLYNDDSMEIKWKYVKAHAGHLGNERADQLAKDGAARYSSTIHFDR